ncbi:MAG TPA: phosphosulfolactate synthase [Candidatus Angelobacter sp.]|jgi:phosphosulfolactate synthase|nr:phosphosulfolactate synthase [Candidatus Angelobacter sp.]
MLSLPQRTQKPRKSGLTIVIDRGIPTEYFKDVINSYGHLIDMIKLGWGTAVVTEQLQDKVKCAHQNKVGIFFGGTFFEKALLQGKLEAYENLCIALDIKYVEISNGSIALPNKDKTRYISRFSSKFKVFSEVGFKDEERSRELAPKSWIEFIREDLDAGATKVIMEARESGRSGICRENGELRYGLITEVLNSGVPADDLIFEAPNKQLQVYFVRKLGANVNFANIAPDDVISLETLRLGLRSDTLELYETGQGLSYTQLLEEITP